MRAGYPVNPAQIYNGNTIYETGFYLSQRARPSQPDDYAGAPPSRALNRPIEKVITYQNRSDVQLRTEVSEYVVTDKINENFQRLLTSMQSALQGGGGHDIGVWVSGFYGSGKSSFTKYLGFALDRGMKVGSDSFLQLLKNRITDAQVPALFNQVSTTYDPVVIFLDLASEMLAGASMEDISTVLYLKARDGPS